MPAQKCSPDPDSTMTATLGFWSRALRAFGNSVKKSSESALREDGRFKIRLKTPELGDFWRISRVSYFSSIFEFFADFERK